jgi:thymidylate synthase
MKPYLDLVRDILDNGSWQDNRTGIRTCSLPGAMMRFDLKRGFPAVTTKRLAFKSAMAELVGFLRASRSAADFRALGSQVWNQNANDNAQWLANPWREGADDLGPVYGAQWRQWPAFKLLDQHHPRFQDRLQAVTAQGYQAVGQVEHSTLLWRQIDQLRQCLDTILERPGDRRILFHAWNPATLDEMALPPCHLLYQFLVNAKAQEISLCLYVRSNDVGLGAPFNLAEGAALLSLVGRLTGYEPRWFSYFIGDAHIYENHLEMLQEQLKRDPLPLPTLEMNPRVPAYRDTGVYAPQWLNQIEPTDFILKEYQHHPPLTAPMAV